tara:strand:- start:3 stop:599 length:597 start_codon:yes stop_codon:yes gene_type:complete
MSAVKFEDVAVGINRIALYFFKEAIQESKLEIFKELTKAVNGFLYRTFGNEEEIESKKQIELAADQVKNWFDGIMTDQIKTIKKIHSEEEGLDDEDAVEQARIAHVSMMFSESLCRYAASTYIDKIEKNSGFAAFQIDKKIIDSYSDNRDDEQLTKCIKQQFNSFVNENNLEMSKKEINRFVNKIISDVKEVFNKDEE